MRGLIRKSVKIAKTLEGVKASLFSVFEELRIQGHTRIGYVSGAITADGKENIPKNIVRLEKLTEYIRDQQEMPVFSAVDVFDEELFGRLDAAGFVNADWEVFWRKVLGAKERYVTDMFMAPRWERSRGASDEHRIAKKVGMTIVYIEEELE